MRRDTSLFKIPAPAKALFCAALVSVVLLLLLATLAGFNDGVQVVLRSVVCETIFVMIRIKVHRHNAGYMRTLFYLHGL